MPVAFLDRGSRFVVSALSVDDTPAAEVDEGMGGGFDVVETAGVVTERCVFGADEDVDVLALLLPVPASPRRDDVAEVTA